MQLTLFIILQNSFRSAFWIVELAVLDAPHKGRKAYGAQKKCNWNKKQKLVHAAISSVGEWVVVAITCLSITMFSPLNRRSELLITMIEESDIAMAAISGVTNPKIASGTAMQL